MQEKYLHTNTEQKLEAIKSSKHQYNESENNTNPHRIPTKYFMHGLAYLQTYPPCMREGISDTFPSCPPHILVVYHIQS